MPVRVPRAHERYEHERNARRRYRPGDSDFRRTARRLTALASTLLAAGLLAGCDTGSGPGPGQVPVTTAAVDEFAAKNRTPDPAAVGIGLTGISAARGDSADRVVLEFTGAATPGWAVHYVNQAIQNSTQQVYPVDGRTVIEVLVREAASPFVSGVPPFAGPETLTDPTLTAIGQIRYAGTVRGVTQVFLGLTTPQVGFRVSALADPTRVVVEVDHR